MTIHHLTWLPDPTGYGGIVEKLSDLQCGAQRAAVDLRVHILTQDGEGGPLLEKARWPTHMPIWLRRIAKSSAIAPFLRSLGPGPIVLRYPGSIDCSLPSLLSEFGNRLFTEHHTDEITELAAMPWGMLRVSLEKNLRRGILPQVRGGIAMTDEIADLCRAGGLRRPILTLSNWVDTERFASTTACRWQGGTLRLLMISGVFWDWQGADRIVRGIASSNCAPQIELHLAGSIRSSELKLLIALCNRKHPGSVIAHGDLKQSQLDQLAAQSHLAVSSLALHRKEMKQACPIKSREYCARGLPFVQSYTDPDFPSDTLGVITLAAGEDAIPVEVLFQAAANAWRDPAVSGHLRTFAASKLDSSVKVRQLADFLLEHMLEP